MGNNFLGGNINKTGLVAMLGQRKIQRPMITFSFDDGYRSDHDIVLPIFKEFGVRGTFYVVGRFDRMENPLLMNELMIKNMSDSGQEIASHGENHIAYLMSDNDTIYEDMVNSKKFLENIIGKEVLSIAYPYGGGDHNTGVGQPSDMTRVKSMARGVYENARGVNRYIATSDSDRLTTFKNMDIYNVACFLNDDLSPTPQSLIDNLLLQDEPKWLNIAYHRIFEDGDSSKPSNRIYASQFRSVVEYATNKSNQGLLDIVPFYEGARRLT